MCRIGECGGDIECQETSLVGRNFHQILQRRQYQFGPCGICGLPSGLQILTAEVMMIREPRAAANLQSQRFTRAAKCCRVTDSAHQVHRPLVGGLQGNCGSVSSPQ